VGRLRRYAEGREQLGEVRIVTVVHDDETGVDLVGLVRRVDTHRVRVATHVRARLVQHDLVITVEQVGRDHPRDARADDREPHAPSSLAGRKAVLIRQV
jgi:hypothetical protein